MNAWFPALLLLVCLGLLPWALKWLQRRVVGLGGNHQVGSMRIVSAVGVGPQQRVVTVEIGPEGQRTWLTLGVTPQSITCLHSAPISFAQQIRQMQEVQHGPAGADKP
ncbi:FliO/MopB family protein [Candidatus Symbiobacter mobilis]|uniref:Flagellar protein FliOZ n=1 Tax=Candidatus Symbiobacter mobilis CR TaxID=946483 RepID=U5NE15_9BURK|nr:flagellar biosynthetic protein FliO [Candidatus Symbiobacter mobilis]AGX88364.1 flagellar protein FliOZ [Candidatus Symbiobacter mobilis CR]